MTSARLIDTRAPADLAGRRVLAVRGTDDRVAPIGRARAVARNLRRRAEVEVVEVTGGKHAMLRHRGALERPAVRFTVQALLDRPREEPPS